MRIGREISTESHYFSEIARAKKVRAKIFNNEKSLLNYKLQSFGNLAEKKKKGAVSRMFCRKLKKCRGAFICKRKKLNTFGPSLFLVLNILVVSDLIFAKLFRNWFVSDNALRQFYVKHSIRNYVFSPKVSVIISRNVKQKKWNSRPAFFFSHRVFFEKS